jgi:4-diphosphocytidyl-2-C-methyl-D-erythritol kinase
MSSTPPLRASAPAKINLGLHVLRRRPDGYHDIETVFHRIGWSDEISVEPAEALSMTCSDPELPTGDDNLCMQAARRLREAHGVDRGAQLHLEKRVPYGAGLGGGSSDAATTLQLLARLWDLDATGPELRELGGQIGSDVPFFLFDAPTAQAKGRGDDLQVLRGADGAPLDLEAFRLVVIAPPVKVSTPEAYGMVTPCDTARPRLAEVVASADLSRWRSELVNDFQKPVAARHEPVAQALTMLDEAGAGYTSLSGSGSAVFGVFDDGSRAQSAAATAAERGWRTWIERRGA